MTSDEHATELTPAINLSERVMVELQERSQGATAGALALAVGAPLDEIVPLLAQLQLVGRVSATSQPIDRGRASHLIWRARTLPLSSTESTEIRAAALQKAVSIFGMPRVFSIQEVLTVARWLTGEKLG